MSCSVDGEPSKSPFPTGNPSLILVRLPPLHSCVIRSELTLVALLTELMKELVTTSFANPPVEGAKRRYSKAAKMKDSDNEGAEDDDDDDEE